MSTLTETLMTAQEFLNRPKPRDGCQEELVRGVVHSMPNPGFRHGKVQGIIAFRLQLFLSTNPIGTLTVESGVQTERGPDTVRGPDVAVWCNERVPLDSQLPGYPDVATDLCVEVLSPSNSPRQIRAKIREYFAAGVRLVWIVDPELQSVTVYRQPDEARLLHDNALLTGEDVLPGFSCPVHQLFTL